MATQSSSSAGVRVLAMVACLVVLPLAAMFGTALPDFAKKVFPRTTPAQAAPSPSSLAEAPRFRPPEPGHARPSLPVTPRPNSVAPLDEPTGDAAHVVCANGVCVRTEPAAPRAETSLAIPSPGAVETVAVEQVRSTLASADQFSHIQQRLRDLGATYYLLETWGNSGDRYRFYCKLAIGGNGSFCRYFEATHADPLQAMAQVLQEVEAWRAERG